MSDFNLISLNSAKDDSKVIKGKRLNTEITLNERDVRVGSDAVLLNFWCGFAEFFFKVTVLRFYKTKRFAVFRKFLVISLRFSYVILCGLGISTSPYAPLLNGKPQGGENHL